MTVLTWINEFYPKPVEDTTPEEAVQHSLTKWEGLTPENLRKHKVRMSDFGYLIGVEPDDQVRSLTINGSTCSLCYHFLDNGGNEVDVCDECPLYKVRGNVPCDVERDDEDVAPWYAFRDNSMGPNTPAPMIFWLEDAVEYQTISNAK